MKKTLLLLTLLLTCIIIHAQQIDKKLLCGRWEIHAMNVDEHCQCRDSSSEIVQRMFLQLNTNCYLNCFDSDDSVMVVDDHEHKLWDMLQYYMTFHKNGTIKVAFGYSVPEYGAGYMEVRGRYKWTGENNIHLKTRKSKSVAYTILHLSATNLILIADVHRGNNEAQMIFTRAK